MKKTLAAATIAALVGVAGAASAADLYKGGSMKDAPVFVPPPTWTGFYLGAHVGGAWGDNKNGVDGRYDRGVKDAQDPTIVVLSSGTYSDGWKNTNDAIFGGGTLGYNFQTGALVFGVEADFGVVGFNTNTHYAGSYDYWNKNDTSFYADVTGRLGYAAGPALFYVKGGWAYLDNSSTYGWSNYTDKNASLDGWTAGGGIEYMWSPSWSVKAEYLHFDFGKQSRDYAYTIGGDTPTQWYEDHTGRYSRDLTVDTFKVGLNYHFANAYAPLK
jgi:opacity protein-like surface antigen